MASWVDSSGNSRLVIFSPCFDTPSTEYSSYDKPSCKLSLAICPRLGTHGRVTKRSAEFGNRKRQLQLQTQPEAAGEMWQGRAEKIGWNCLFIEGAGGMEAARSLPTRNRGPLIKGIL